MEQTNAPQVPVAPKKSKTIGLCSLLLGILAFVLLIALQPSEEGVKLTAESIDEYISGFETAAMVGLIVAILGVIAGIYGIIKSSKGLSIAGIIISCLALLLSVYKYQEAKEVKAQFKAQFGVLQDIKDNANKQLEEIGDAAKKEIEKIGEEGKKKIEEAGN